MSIRAYKIINIKNNYQNYKLITEKRIKKDSTFNLWHDTRIFEMFQDFGIDNTNEDCIGELSIKKEDFMEAYKNKKWTEEEKKILNLIKSEFDEDEIYYDCF